MRRRLSASIVLVLVLGACAQKPTIEENDPFEPLNRAVFGINNGIDKVIARPVAEVYVAAVPEFARDGVHNFLANLDSPVTFANDVLQGEMHRAGETLVRAGFNTTAGIGGLIDVADAIGIPPHTEDFGQTMAVWGFREGPYLVLPLVGPSNARDVTGMGVDVFFDPLTYAEYENKTFWSILRYGAVALDVRARNIETLDAVERSSIDYYAAMRNLYRQRRDNEIRNNKPDPKGLPEFMN